MVSLPYTDKIFRYLKLFFLFIFIMTILVPVTRVSADGAAGTALYFDGVNDYVFIGETNTIMGGASWKDTMTVSFWVKPIGSGYCANIDVVHCDLILGDRPDGGAFLMVLSMGMIEFGSGIMMEMSIKLESLIPKVSGCISPGSMKMVCYTHTKMEI